MKANTANFQYALLGSGAVVAWLLTATVKSGERLRYPVVDDWIEFAWVMPLFTASLFCALSVAGLFQIGRIKIYLQFLEGQLKAGPQYGWEQFFKPRAPTFQPVFIYGWTLLLLGDFGIAVFLPGLP